MKNQCIILRQAGDEGVDFGGHFDDRLDILRHVRIFVVVSNFEFSLNGVLPLLQAMLEIREMGIGMVFFIAIFFYYVFFSLIGQR